MNVLVFDQQTDLTIDHASVKPVVEFTLAEEKQKTDEVAIYFVSTEEICRLHQEFFDDPSPTDCISFPLDKAQGVGYHVLGEVFVCPQTAVEYVLKSGEEKSENPYAEMTLYVVHGLLHLLGYDDVKDSDREKMRAAEARIMEPLIRQKLLLKR